MSTQIDDRMEFYLMTTSKSTWNGLFSTTHSFENPSQGQEISLDGFPLYLGGHIGNIFYLEIAATAMAYWVLTTCFLFK